jgi:hypothetical protein
MNCSTVFTRFATVKPNSLNKAPAGADSPITVQTDDRTLDAIRCADILVPAVADAGFDGDARHAFGQHGLAVGGVLRDRTRWCRASTPRAPARRLQRRAAPRAPAPLRAGGDQDRLGRAGCRLEHVAAARDAASCSALRGWCGRFWRESTGGRPVVALDRAASRPPRSRPHRRAPEATCSASCAGSRGARPAGAWGRPRRGRSNRA